MGIYKLNRLCGFKSHKQVTCTYGSDVALSKSKIETNKTTTTNNLFLVNVFKINVEQGQRPTYLSHSGPVENL